MADLSVGKGRVMRGMRMWVIAAAVGCSAAAPQAQSEDIAGAGFSGWRGGIGIAFGAPGAVIPDVTELGYEVYWGSEPPKVCSALDLAMFGYWNSVIEMGLSYTSPKTNYNFSAMADKDEAARLAFDAWAEISYGVKGLSQYATVRYFPQGTYGDVLGKMDLSSENPLTLAVIDTQVKRFTDNKLRRGGIGIDNLSAIPGGFIALLRSRLNPHGLGIAVNSFPKALKESPYIRDIDVAGAEGFPYSVEFARTVRAKGFNGIFCEFTMQHLSSAELSAYLRSKLFYGIVFFGYTDGGGAASSQYSFYASRPDVYNHHRWVFRKYVLLSRALFGARGQKNPFAQLEPARSGVAVSEEIGQAQPDVRPDGSGALYEKDPFSASMRAVTGMSPNTPAAIFRFGETIDSGIYYFVSSPVSETVVCDARRLKLDAGVVVFDEINERMINGVRTDSTLRFSTAEGPAVVQLGSRSAIAKNLVARMETVLAQADRQKALEIATKVDPLRKAWAPLCQGWTLDSGAHAARSGRSALATLGGKYDYTFKKWKYYNRQGGAQFVALDQKVPTPVTVCAWSKAEAVPGSVLDAIGDRRAYFICRETNTYAMHVYLDYQDGHWPETHTVAFSDGTHDWEKRSVTVNPKKPVKTAMVLLEFQQPSGKAWFDDVSLVQGKGTANALAYSGFERECPENAASVSVRTAYETRLSRLRGRIGEILAQASIKTSDLADIGKEATDMDACLSDSGAAPLFGRERRDLADIRHWADVCLAVLTKE